MSTIKTFLTVFSLSFNLLLAEESGSLLQTKSKSKDLHLGCPCKDFHFNRKKPSGEDKLKGGCKVCCKHQHCEFGIKGFRKNSCPKCHQKPPCDAVMCSPGETPKKWHIWHNGVVGCSCEKALECKGDLVPGCHYCEKHCNDFKVQEVCYQDSCHEHCGCPGEKPVLLDAEEGICGNVEKCAGGPVCPTVVIKCEDDEYKVDLAHECPRCEKLVCTAVVCGDDEYEVKVPHACPTCAKDNDCSLVRCASEKSCTDKGGSFHQAAGQCCGLCEIITQTVCVADNSSPCIIEECMEDGTKATMIIDCPRHFMGGDDLCKGNYHWEPAGPGQCCDECVETNECVVDTSDPCRIETCMPNGGKSVMMMSCMPAGMCPGTYTAPTSDQCCGHCEEKKCIVDTSDPCRHESCGQDGTKYIALVDCFGCEGGVLADPEPGQCCGMCHILADPVDPFDA